MQKRQKTEKITNLSVISHFLSQRFVVNKMGVNQSFYLTQKYSHHRKVNLYDGLYF